MIIVSLIILNRKGLVLDYSVPQALQINRNSNMVGCRVIVPIQGKPTLGLVLEVLSQSQVPSDRLQAIWDWIDDVPLLPRALLDKIIWSSRYYGGQKSKSVYDSIPKLLRRWTQTKNSWKLLRLQKKIDSKNQSASQFVRSYFHYDENNRIAWDRFKEVDLGSNRSFNEISQSLTLNENQQSALTAILAPESKKNILLYGVTASGKTRLYLALMQRKSQRDGACFLVLVPEIGLIPSMEKEIKAAGFDCSVYHGGLSEKEQLSVWQDVYFGRIQVVCGTRSSIWLPFQTLDLIIVDEEHDGSYKSQRGLRENARDVVCWMGKNLEALVLLGSATPSLETLYNVKIKKFTQISMLTRAASGATFPKVIWNHEDFLTRRSRKRESEIAASYREVIQKTLCNHQYALIILNRRGFAERLFCKSCAKLLCCPQCDHPYIYHMGLQQVRCTVCKSLSPLPSACFYCEQRDWLGLGFGTEKLGSLLSKAFPDTPLCCCDQETVPKPSLLFERLNNFYASHPYGILFGTQMISKGHDFQNVGLSLLIHVDRAFFSQDLKAEERFCQLYTQVLGRAGRDGGQGLMVLQTHFADHPTALALRRGGYLEAADLMLKERVETQAFPTTRWLQIWAEAYEHKEAEGLLSEIKERLVQKKELSELIQLGPALAPIPKSMNRWRWVLEVGGKVSQRNLALHWVRQWLPERPSKTIRSWLEVDPY